MFLAAVGGDGAGEPEIDGQRLACIAEGLRLLVTLFRNRLSFVSENEHLRLQLINWLCAKERCTHSQISKELSHALQAHPKLDEILREIADYSAPRLQEHGHYTLKKAFWDDFDPYFAHFSREDAENALDRAMQSGAWAPKQQLRTPGRPPAPLGDILAVLAAPATHQLIWAALRYTWDRDDGSSNGITIHALHLLSLCAAHDAEAVRIFESKQKPHQVTSSTVAAVLGNAVTPAGFQGGSILEAVVHCPSGGSPILGLLEAVQAKGLNKDPEDFLAKSSQIVHECATAVLETLQVHGGSRGRSVSVPSSPSRRAGGAKVWKQTAKEVQAAALAEMAGDKMPFAPDRRIPPSFAFRLAIGAVGGWALAGQRTSPEFGALAGAAGAVAGTLIGRSARGGDSRTASGRSRGLAEDAAAVVLVALVIASAEGPPRAPRESRARGTRT